MDQITILFEDDWLLVLNKPAGITVNNAVSEKDPTIEDWLKSNRPNDLERNGIVHRLDKETSGVLIIAKTAAALLQLQSQFKEREIQKEYVALVHGTLAETTGTIAEPIGRNPMNRTKFAIVQSGRESETKWQVEGYKTLVRDKIAIFLPNLNKNQTRYYLANGVNYTLLRLFPKTGRTHQIRVHLTALRHPLVSDTVYTAGKLVKLDLCWCSRQFLHAEKLMLRHPATGQQLRFVAALPKDLTQALSQLS